MNLYKIWKQTEEYCSGVGSDFLASRKHLPDTVSKPPDRYSNTEVLVVDNDTLDESSRHRNCCCINMGNSVAPGGGVKKGLMAQEEDLSKRYYSLSSRIMVERDGYYDILERSQKSTLDITGWLLWFLKCYTRAISDSEAAISKVLLKAAFWQRHAQTILNKNQQKVINRLLEAGPKGFEGGLSTRKYVGITKVSRATAYRDITDLLEKKILVQNKSKGRSVSYELVFPESY